MRPARRPTTRGLATSLPLSTLLLAFLGGVGVGCTPAIEDGALRCDPSLPDSCPTGFFCLRRGGEPTHTCLSAADDYCGDGRIGTQEQCDGAQLGAATCRDLGYFGGQLACGAGCRFDESGCFRLESLSAGHAHVAGLDDHGAVWVWGLTGIPLTAEGAALPPHVPRRLSPQGLELASISSGLYHTCAVDYDGRAHCGGDNGFGQLGIGASTATMTKELREVRSDSRFTAIAAGAEHSCGLDVSGRIWCWGDNTFGQLGDGSQTSYIVPVRVAGDLRFSAVHAAGPRSCGLDPAGQAYCWGFNENGELGLGHFRPAVTPEPVAAAAPFTEIALGDQHGCGLDGSGTAHCWGLNDSGQVGDRIGPPISRPTPVQLEQRFTTLTLSSMISCGRTEAGETRCWGLLPVAQGAEPSPVSVALPGFTGSGWVTAGFASLCAIDPTRGSPYCLGWNGAGQLGVPRGGVAPQPLATATPFEQLSVNALGGCALTAAGDAHCWGWYGVSGSGRLENRLAPAPVATPERFATLSTGIAHVCASSALGGTYCWGAGTEGSLGTLTDGLELLPRRIADAPGLVAVTAGLSHTCGLDTDGLAWGWGAGARGQLGDGSSLSRPTAAPAAVPVPLQSLAAGAEHTCGLDADGQAWCWGRNTAMQLGLGDRVDRLWPEPLATTAPFVALATGFHHTCGLDADGRLWCWGNNSCSELGVAAGEVARPTPVDTDVRFSAVAVGSSYSCGLGLDGTIRCWGCNEHGQLGDGTTLRRTSPTPITSELRFRALSASTMGYVTCAIDEAGQGWCWGFSEVGGLGTGDVHLSLREVTPPFASP